MRLQHELDLTRVHVESASDDQLLQPAADGERAVVAELAHVAGAEEAVTGERLLGRLGVAPVTLEHLAAFEQHLTRLAELHLDARERIADAARLARPVIWIRDHDAALGDAVALDWRLAEQLRASLEQRRRQRRRARHEDANMTQVGPVLLEPVADALIHGGHSEQHRPARVIFSSELGDDRGGRERHERGAGAAEECSVQAHAQAVHVEHRQRVDQDVVRRPPPYLHRAAALREESAVVDDRALRAAGGARCVHDRGGTLGRELRHGRGRAFGQVLEGNDALADLLDHRCSLRVSDDHGRLGVVDDVRGLGRVVVRVHRHKHRARALQPEIGDHPVERGGRVKADALAGLDANRGQAAGHSLGLRAQLVASQLAIARPQNHAMAGLQQLGGQRARAEPAPERLHIGRG